MNAFKRKIKHVLKDMAPYRIEEFISYISNVCS
nr:unnamed protein product [Callosobruchus chinensis]